MTTILNIFFKEDNPQGTFLQNDVVTVDFDDSTESIVVNLNGSPLTSGDDIIPAPLNWNGGVLSREDDIKSEIYTSLFICSGSNGVSFERISQFPYLSFFIAPSAFCGTVTVCNLAISPAVSVTNESTPGASDGSIAVTATSSNSPIQYKLEPFMYGEGQSSGTFTNLSPGTYTVFARDTLNCLATIQVVIGIDSLITYNARFRGQWVDINGVPSACEIRERDYSGSVTDIDMGDDPIVISLRGEGESDIYSAIIPIEAVISVVATDSNSFDVLYTDDPRKFKVVYIKDGVELWDGFLLPNQYVEGIVNYPTVANLTAVDAMASAGEISFLRESGMEYSGRISAIKLISEILKRIEVNKPIRSGCNLYASGMNTTAADDPLAQTYIDLDRYYLNDIPTFRDILNDILTVFGARMIIWGGYANIQRLDETIFDFDFRNFNANGDYVTNGTYVQNKDIGNEFVWAERTQVKQILPAYGGIIINYDLGKDNILRNGNFRLKLDYAPIINTYFFTPDLSGWEVIPNTESVIVNYETIENRNIALSIYGKGLAYLLSDSYTIASNPSNILKIRIRCKVASSFGRYVKIKVRMSYGTYHLKSDGSWVNATNEFAFYATKFNEYSEFELSAQSIYNYTTTQDLGLQVRVYSAWWKDAEFATLSSLKAKTTTTIGVGTKTELLDGSFAILYYELENNTSSADDINIVRPNDYHATTNPVQWILKERRSGSDSGGTVFYDYIRVESIDNSSEAPEKKTITYVGNKNNKETLERDISIGSINYNVSVIPSWGLDVFSGDFNFQIIFISTINAIRIYRGFLQKSDGTPWGNWTRDGLSESMAIENILLSSYKTQFSSPSTKLTGTLTSRNAYLYPTDALNDLINTDLKYVLMSWVFHDKMNMYEVEMISKKPVSDEGMGYGFSIGYSKGFNA